MQLGSTVKISAITNSSNSSKATQSYIKKINFCILNPKRFNAILHIAIILHLKYYHLTSMSLLISIRLAFLQDAKYWKRQNHC